MSAGRARRSVALLLAVVAGAILAARLGRRSEHPTIVVSAAASLDPAFREIARAFEEETGVHVLLNFAATGVLAQQIERGAPVDVFAAADASFVDELAGAGALRADTRRPFARGRLVLWRPAGHAAIRELAGLADASVQRVAIANPSHAPYGRAARQALEAAGVWSAVEPKLVLMENVEQAYRLAASGNVDAALVALSVLRGDDARSLPVPDALYAPLRNELAVVRGTHNVEAARRFAAFIGGAEARRILRGHGLVPTGEE